METFLARHRPSITVVLSGFDRLVFRGSLIPLIRKGGMYTFLQRSGVQLLGFKDFVLTTSERLKDASKSAGSPPRSAGSFVYCARMA